MKLNQPWLHYLTLGELKSQRAVRANAQYLGLRTTQQVGITTREVNKFTYINRVLKCLSKWCIKSTTKLTATTGNAFALPQLNLNTQMKVRNELCQ